MALESFTPGHSYARANPCFVICCPNPWFIPMLLRASMLAYVGRHIANTKHPKSYSHVFLNTMSSEARVALRHFPLWRVADRVQRWFGKHASRRHFPTLEWILGDEPSRELLPVKDPLAHLKSAGWLRLPVQSRFSMLDSSCGRCAKSTAGQPCVARESGSEILLRLRNRDDQSLHPLSVRPPVFGSP